MPVITSVLLSVTFNVRKRSHSPRTFRDSLPHSVRGCTYLHITPHKTPHSPVLNDEAQQPPSFRCLFYFTTGFPVPLNSFYFLYQLCFYERDIKAANSSGRRSVASCLARVAGDGWGRGGARGRGGGRGGAAVNNQTVSDGLTAGTGLSHLPCSLHRTRPL